AFSAAAFSPDAAEVSAFRAVVRAAAFFRGSSWAAAALATNELRVAYALHPVRLLVELRAVEAVPALITTLRRRLRPHDPYRTVALACVEGLGTLGDARARPVLDEALAHPALAEAAVHALARIPGRH
ncbi:hypothetical protein ACWEQU_28020, partial [Streptomyces nodosus]